MDTLRLRPLTADAFARFGAVLEAPDGVGRRAAADAIGAAAGRPFDLGIVRQAPRALPLRAVVMERHRHSSQTFLPLDAASWIVLAAPTDATDGPDMEAARAFLARPDQGVTYARDVWHHPLTVLGREARFAILMWAAGDASDTEFHEVPPLLIEG